MKFLVIIFSIFCDILCIPLSDKENIASNFEKSDDIIILHTNDVHCGVQDTIGYDGLMLYKKQLLKKYNNVILVDSGDHIQGGTMGSITNGESIIEIMNKLEYEAVTLGNHEFDYGITQLETLDKLLNCSYISANYCYRKNKTSIYPPYKIIEKGNKKIGFIGVATPETLIKSYIITLLDNSGQIVYDFLNENNCQVLYDRIQKHIEELKKENVDYIIILGHLGFGKFVSEENSSTQLLKNLKNVNAFIDGHTHLVYSITTPDKEGKNIILVQTGTKLSNIGVLTIHENGTLSHKNIDEVPYEPNLANETLNVTRNNKVRYVDKEMNEFIKDIFDSFSDKLNEVIGKTDFPLSINFSKRTKENAFYNIICDSLKEFGKADISIINNGAVRSNLNKGNILYKDIINSLPFSNDVIIKEIPGKVILEALEYGVRALPSSGSGIPQVSGITYKVDISINSPVIIDDNGSFQKIEGERRVYDVKINGEKLDINKIYTISSNSFILSGGDGYSMFIGLKIIETSIGLDNEIFIKYIKDNLKGIIPLKYKETEGRIIITNGKIYDNIKISLLGFNNLNISSQMIKFNVYFVSLEKLSFEFPRQLNLKVSLSNKRKLRSLQEIKKNISCFIQNEENEIKVKYLCEVHCDISEIQNIRIEIPEYNNFDVEIGPLAFNYMNNLENIQNDNKLENLNKNLYVLQNAVYHIKEGSILISGIINNTILPSFINKQLNLTLIQLPYKISKEINCIINNLTKNSYTLYCKLNPNIKFILDNSILIDDDKLLLISLDKEDKNKIIDGDQIDLIESIETKKDYNNSNKNISSDWINFIILLSIVLILIMIGTILIILLLRKSNKFVVLAEAKSVESFKAT